jgi:hypothetical protein
MRDGSALLFGPVNKKVCNPKNGVGSGTPYLIIRALFVTKYDDVFDQEEVLIILSTLRAPFFPQRNWSFGGSKNFGGPNFHPKPIILMGLPRKIANMRKICKYVQS